MEYQRVVKRDRAEIELLLCGTDPSDVLDALLSAAYYDPDWRWVQGQCLTFLGHHERDIRPISAICLGHLARIHKQLNLELVLPRLADLKDDPEIDDGVQDALDDIRFYLKFQWRSALGGV